MNELFSKVANYVKSLSNAFFILDTILGLVVGGLVGALLEGSVYASILTVVLILALPFFVVLLYLKATVEKNFPTAVIEELKARYELDRVKKNIARKRTIDGYIETAIQSLNQQTCSLTQERMNELCERDVEEGLRSVIGPIVELPNYILDCNASDFTVGAYLIYSFLSAIDQDLPELIWIPNIFVLRDDLDLEKCFVGDLMDDQEASGVRFDLQTALKRTHNHGKFFESVFSHEQKDYTIVTSPIPQVCEGDWLTGVLFIVVERLGSLPEDLERVLLIFNRILTNWLSKYNDCNQNKLQAARIL